MSAPKRIQRQRTKGWRMPESAAYVGRPTVFGNPAIIERDTQRGFVIWAACWCPSDQPCHADVLLEVANRAHE